MHCSSCRHENRGGAKFCEDCGAALTDVPERPQPTVRLPASIGGRYTPTALLGEGARKRVYLARDERLGRDVAVAVLRTEGLDADGRARAAREAQAMARLGDHPLIVTVHDVGDDGGSLFMVSQHMPGGSLAEWLDAAPGRRVPARQAMAFAEQVARALEHAHRHDVVHRDVKPANVWIDGDGSCVLGDFGLAVPLDVSRVTEEGIVVGTVSYLAPEQAIGRPPDPRADLYSLGALLYECLSGRPPFLGDDAVTVISQHLNTAPVAPSWHEPTVPPALDRLVLRLLSKDPAERPGTAEEVAAELAALLSVFDSKDTLAATSDEGGRPGPLGEWGRFVGRPEELARLRVAFDESLSGRTRVSMVLGEPGIGKTRLVEELAAYASMRGAQVCWGHCYEGEVGLPYVPFAEALRGYVRTVPDAVLLRGSTLGLAELATLVPDLRERMPGLPVLPSVDGDADRLRLFEGAASFIRSASAVQPVVLVLDDLHWADKASLLLLRHLAYTVDDARLLIVGTYRDVALDRTHPLVDLVGDLRRQRLYERVLLRGLGRQEVKELVDAIAGQEAPAELVDLLFSETEGNPFFVQEILRHLVETGALRREGGQWVGTAGDVAESLPEGIRQVIGRRLDALSTACNEMLAVVCAMPGGFTLDVAAAVMGADDETALDALDEALSAQVVRERRDRKGSYELNHALVRQALYAELSTPRRVRLHRRIVDAIEATASGALDEHLPELAYHANEAAPGGDVQKSVAYARSAAGQAMRQAAYEDAVRYYDMALQSLELSGTPSDEARADLLIDLGRASNRAGNAERRKATCREAAALADRLDDPERLAHAAITMLGTLGPDGGNVDPDVVDTLDRAADVLRRAQATPVRRALLAEVLARESGYVSNRLPERSEPLVTEALDVARAAGDARSLTLALLNSTQTYALSREEHLGRLAEAAVLAAEVGDLDLRLTVDSNTLHGALMWADRDAYDAALADFADVAGQTRAPNHLALSAIDRAAAATVDGRYAEAEQLLRAASARAKPLADPSHAATIASAMVPVHRELRGLAGSVRSARRALESTPGAPVYRSFLAQALAAAGEHDEARRLVDDLVERDTESLLAGFLRRYCLATLSEATAVLGHADAAKAIYPWLERELEFGEAVIVGPDLYLGAVQRYLGLLAATLGRWDDAVFHHEAGLEVHERMRARGWAARSRYDLARALLERDGPGDAARAVRLVRESISAAHELGMAMLLDELVSLKLELQGVSPHSSPAASIDAVSAAVGVERPDLAGHAGSDGHVTVCFSDIVGYTSMTDRLGDERTHEVLRVHNEILRRELRAAGGVEVKSEGDGFMLVFPDTARALRFASSFLRALDAREWPADIGPVRVRVGMHRGEVIRDADDFFGRTVIVGARVAAQAAGGEVLVTEAVWAEAGDAFAFGDRRDLSLKGLRDAHAVRPLVRT